GVPRCLGTGAAGCRPPRPCRRRRAGDVHPLPWPAVPWPAGPQQRRPRRRRNRSRMSLGPEAPDLDACAREPIHIPGSIQPQGILLVVDPADGRVLQASANAAAELLGGQGQVQGQRWDELLQLAPAQAAALRPVEQAVHLAHAPCTVVRTGLSRWTAAWHLYPQRSLLELEPAQGAQSLALGDALRAQREIDRAPDIAEAARHAAAEIRAL